jgi:hypothetical protein
MRERRTERDVAAWTFEAPTRECCWHDMIEDTGQEGWTLDKNLDLPRKLRQCVQDLNHNGIKVRHKMKLTVALKNPDGHVSELRATLPLSIFISPNMPFDEQGELVQQAPGAVGSESSSGGGGVVAPPGYGEHVLDQLCDNVSSGAQTPATTPSPISSRNSSLYYYSLPHSRAGSAEDLGGDDATTATTPSSSLASPSLSASITMTQDGIAAAALSSRLQSVPLDASQRNASFNSLVSSQAPSAPLSRTNSLQQQHQHTLTAPSTAPSTPPTRSSSVRSPLSRCTTRSSGEDSTSSRRSSIIVPDTHPELPPPRLEDLNKVPSYATAVRTRPARLRPFGADDVTLPDYESATAPSTPTATDTPDPMLLAATPTMTRRTSVGDRSRPATAAEAPTVRLPRTTGPRPLSFSSFLLQRFDIYERRRSSLLVQSRA